MTCDCRNCAPPRDRGTDGCAVGVLLAAVSVALALSAFGLLRWILGWS